MAAAHGVESFPSKEVVLGGHPFKLHGIVADDGYFASVPLLEFNRHWVQLPGVLAPLVIGELITDPAKRWKAVRLSSVGTAVAFEVLYTIREQQRRKEQEAKLADCRSRE